MNEKLMDTDLCHHLGVIDMKNGHLGEIYELTFIGKLSMRGAPMKIITVIGARPQFIKAAVVSKVIAAQPWFG